MLGPILRGEKISLEPPQLEDLPIFRSWFANLEVTRTLLFIFPPSEAGEEEWYRRGAESDRDVLWRIVVESRTVGTTAIHQISWLNRHATSGLLIGETDAWGKGYASEAVRLRTDFAFAELGLERLETESFAGNKPMHRALEKAGYHPIGRRSHHIWRNGAWHDAILFELLRDEWRTRQR